jgi:hypothetical protein
MAQGPQEGGKLILLMRTFINKDEIEAR